MAASPNTESTTIRAKCNPTTRKIAANLHCVTCSTCTYVVELEGYRVGKRLYIKEICILHLNGEPFDHRLCSIPATPPGDKTQKFTYHHIHGLPFFSTLDKSLPRLPAKSLLITHGLEKAGLLQRLYPHCKVICWRHEEGYTEMRDNAHNCPLLHHGPACAFHKAHKLHSWMMGIF